MLHVLHNLLKTLFTVTDFLMEHPYNDPSEEPSPAAKRARREPSIVDATEDEQLQAAMQASINQNKVPQTVIIDSDSDSNDIETFSGSEDDVSQSPLKSSPNVKSTKSAKEKINDDKTNTDRASNDQDLKNDSINNISNLSESESSMLNNTGSSDNYCLSEDRNYKHFLGKDTGKFECLLQQNYRTGIQYVTTQHCGIIPVLWEKILH